MSLSATSLVIDRSIRLPAERLGEGRRALRSPCGPIIPRVTADLAEDHPQHHRHLAPQHGRAIGRDPDQRHMNPEQRTATVPLSLTLPNVPKPSSTGKDSRPGSRNSPIATWWCSHCGRGVMPPFFCDQAAWPLASFVRILLCAKGTRRPGIRGAIVDGLRHHGSWFRTF